MFDRFTRKNLGFFFTLLDPEFPVCGMNIGNPNAVAIDGLYSANLPGNLVGAAGVCYHPTGHIPRLDKKRNDLSDIVFVSTAQFHVLVD
jgi:hypothetical protein